MGITGAQKKPKAGRLTPRNPDSAARGWRPTGHAAITGHYTRRGMLPASERAHAVLSFRAQPSAREGRRRRVCVITRPSVSRASRLPPWGRPGIDPHQRLAGRVVLPATMAPGTRRTPAAPIGEVRHVKA
jgi:hypothetical protein